MKEAIKWYEMGAKSNEPTCVFTLGLIYEEGDGVQKNILKAADWYQKEHKPAFLLVCIILGS